MKQPRFAVFCHAADALPNPQGLAASRRRKNLFRSAGIKTIHQNPDFFAKSNVQYELV